MHTMGRSSYAVVEEKVMLFSLITCETNYLGNDDVILGTNIYCEYSIDEGEWNKTKENGSLDQNTRQQGRDSIWC